MEYPQCTRWRHVPSARASPSTALPLLLPLLLPLPAPASSSSSSQHDACTASHARASIWRTERVMSANGVPANRSADAAGQKGTLGASAGSARAYLRNGWALPRAPVDRAAASHSAMTNAAESTTPRSPGFSRAALRQAAPTSLRRAAAALSTQLWGMRAIVPPWAMSLAATTPRPALPAVSMRSWLRPVAPCSLSQSSSSSSGSAAFARLLLLAIGRSAGPSRILRTTYWYLHTTRKRHSVFVMFQTQNTHTHKHTNTNSHTANIASTHTHFW